MTYEWKHYRGYCLTTMLTDRDQHGHKETPGFLSGPVLRAHFVDHPTWGVVARLKADPELRQKLKPIIRIPHGWHPDVVLADDILICQCIQAEGHQMIHWRRFVDIWGPGGPLEIPEAEWQADAEFVAWMEFEGAA